MCSLLEILILEMMERKTIMKTYEGDNRGEEEREEQDGVVCVEEG